MLDFAGARDVRRLVAAMVSVLLVHRRPPLIAFLGDDGMLRQSSVYRPLGPSGQGRCRMDLLRFEPSLSVWDLTLASIHIGYSRSLTCLGEAIS